MNSRVISQHLQLFVRISVNGGGQVERKSNHFSMNCSLFVILPRLVCISFFFFFFNEKCDLAPRLLAQTLLLSSEQ